MRGFRSQTWSHSGFTLLPMCVSSGPISPPTIFPAAFCVAWQEAQNDSPYRLAPATGSGRVLDTALMMGAVSPAAVVLLLIRNAEMSRASLSLRLKFGIVVEAEYASGSFSHA